MDFSKTDILFNYTNSRTVRDEVANLQQWYEPPLTSKDTTTKGQDKQCDFVNLNKSKKEREREGTLPGRG